MSVKPYLLHQLLQRAAGGHPDATAVVDRDRHITYAELDERSNQLANLLFDLGVRRGDRVGLYLDKSLESVLGVYGVLKSGAAYVPLDPDAPVRRLGYIAGDCGLRVLLSGGEKASQWDGLIRAGATFDAVVELNHEGAGTVDGPVGVRRYHQGDVAAQPKEGPVDRSIGFDLAYILYTSGSTGQPKGVMLSHLNAMTFVEWAASEFGVTAHDRLSNHAPLHFDLSVFDLFAAAMAAASVVLIPLSASILPAELLQFLARNRISVWYSVPSVLATLAVHGRLGQSDSKLPDLRAVLFAGEVFPTKYLRRLMDQLPHVRFANLYGPTETNVCTWYEVPPIPEGHEEPIPIGKPIPNVDVFVVTDDGRAAPPGQPGELCVRGATVMQGYWNDSERTARVLVSNGAGAGLENRIYRTGDLGLEQPDGNFRFLGRRDSQIKRRGYRIELGEIETALYSHPAVAECAVVATSDERSTTRITAYVVSRKPLDVAELLRHVEERIPRYMLPDHIELRDSLPKTSTGKIERRALAGMSDADVARRP